VNERTLLSLGLRAVILHLQLDQFVKNFIKAYDSDPQVKQSLNPDANEKYSMMDPEMLKFFNASDNNVPLDARGFLNQLNFGSFEIKLSEAITANRYKEAQPELKKLKDTFVAIFYIYQPMTHELNYLFSLKKRQQI